MANLSIRVALLDEWLESFLARNTTVESLELYLYSKPVGLQERVVLDSEEEAVIQSAKLLKAETGRGFWDSLLGEAHKSGLQSSRIARECLFHQGPGAHLRTVKRTELTGPEFFGSLGAQASSGRIGMSSRTASTEGRHLHIPMIDFACPPLREDESFLHCVCEQLFSTGYTLVPSGGSYHALGTSLVSEDGRIDFLARCLLFAPLVDSRYVAHQLMQPFSTLRVYP